MLSGYSLACAYHLCLTACTANVAMPRIASSATVGTVLSPLGAEFSLVKKHHSDAVEGVDLPASR